MHTPNTTIGGALFHPETWPHITHLNDILPLVEHNKGIRLFRQGPIQILRYLINDPSVFQTPYDLECRGLIFDAHTGNLLSRPLHKFHNHAGPTTENILMAAGPVQLFDKLDGSMLGGFILDGQVVLHTKGGFSPQARIALERLPKEHRALVQEAWNLGATPVFEWIGPDNRIVLSYPHEDFVLLAVRDRLTGTYLDELADTLAQRYGVTRPQLLGVAQNVRDLHHWSSKIATMEGVEGVVAVGPDGRRAKLKTRSYLAVHKALSMLSHPRHAFRAVVEELDDDLVPILPPNQAAFFTSYATSFRQRVLELATEAETMASNLNTKHQGNKKAMATEVTTTIEPLWRPLVFAALNNQNPTNVLLNTLRKRTGTNRAAEEISNLYKLPAWNPPEGLFLQD